MNHIKVLAIKPKTCRLASFDSISMLYERNITIDHFNGEGHFQITFNAQSYSTLEQFSTKSELKLLFILVTELIQIMQIEYPSFFLTNQKFLCKHNS